MNFMEFVKTKNQTKPQAKRPATDKQIEFATAISELLEVDKPDFADFSATSKFISDHVDLYYETKDEADDFDGGDAWMYDGCGNGK